MAPLERLFALEVEFHRRLRDEAPDLRDPAALHTSYALQAGYEPLLRRVGRITFDDLDRLAQRHLAAADPRDVVAAREALARLLGVAPLGA
jgi:hypothetical protein